MEHDLTGPHLEALESRFNSDLTAIRASAESARAAVDGDAASLHAFSGNGSSYVPPPADFTAETPPYVPPPLAYEGALIPDTPLIDGPLANQSLAFDDAPLWQN